MCGIQREADFINPKSLPLVTQPAYPIKARDNFVSGIHEYTIIQGFKLGVGRNLKI